MRRYFKLTAAAVATLMTLSACGTLTPHNYPENSLVTVDRAEQHYADQWDEQPIVREGRPLVVLQRPMDVPAEMLERRVNVRLEQGANVRDMVALLANLGVSIMLVDRNAGEREFYMPRYEGTLGGLLSALTKAADVWFTWEDGVIMVSGTAKIALSLPQDEALADVVQKQLGELLKEPRNLSTASGKVSEGDSALSVSFQAGMANFVVSPGQYARLQSYLERIARNAAVVTLQVAVVSVALKQDSSQGIDWSSMQMALGSHSQGYRDYLNKGLQKPSNNPGMPVPVPGETGTDGTGTPGTGTGTSNEFSDPGRGLYFSGSSLRGIVTSKFFSLAGFYSFLQDYGTTTVQQNLLLKTVTGNEVVLESVTEIPYVSEVGVTTSNTSNQNLSAMGSAQTEKAKDGVTIKLNPVYDEASNMVTINMDLSIEAVIAFNELSAGSQLGTLTQPTTAKRQFTDILRMRPGATAVVGGLTYDSISNNATGPIGLERSPLEYKSIKSERQTMFVVVRPTVAVLGVPDANEAPTVADALKEPMVSAPATAADRVEPAPANPVDVVKPDDAAVAAEPAWQAEQARMRSDIERLGRELAEQRERADKRVVVEPVAPAAAAPAPAFEAPRGPAAPEGYRQLSL